ncbi:MAG TPA: tripartite tricarboxylate transporter permease [Pseudogracilibacillus sp.]|nr:tripartite tricarboxylate transporter permease [Pseudogracilibacillus sp.]
MSEILFNMSQGFSEAISPINVLLVFLGALIGMVVGIIPGFGASAAIAILLPFSFSLEPISAIIFLAGIYYGSMYGGATTSILINTPGDSAAVVTTFDGYPMTRQGKAGKALIVQAIASFIGGTIGVILIFTFAPMFTEFALKFGPPEYFMLMVMGLLTLVWMTEGSKLKGFISALIGIGVATIGVDVITGVPRFTFGSPELIDGVNFVPVAVGLFGIGEILYRIYDGSHKSTEDKTMDLSLKSKENWPKPKELIQSTWSFLRSSVIGFVTGVLPGAGATIASFFTYTTEKKLSKEPEKFGTGHIPGLIAPESSNNAATAGSMIPLLTLGIPGSAATAVLLGAFLMFDLEPGPLLMKNNPEFSWGIISSMYLGNIALLVVNIIAIPLFLYVIKTPYRLLIPIILILCTVGTYSLNNNIMEIWILFIFGVIGFFMKHYGYSPASLVLALVLGPLVEDNLRQSLIASHNGLGIFLSRPISLALLIVILIIVAYPYIKKTLMKKG